MFGGYFIFLNLKKCPLFIYSTIMLGSVKNHEIAITIGMTRFEGCYDFNIKLF
jgi:hypothetical protein|nr:MAG TPA_asm: hypothetical protein [Caudoviricetes sp.]